MPIHNDLADPKVVAQQVNELWAYGLSLEIIATIGSAAKPKAVYEWLGGSRTTTINNLCRFIFANHLARRIEALLSRDYVLLFFSTNFAELDNQTVACGLQQLSQYEDVLTALPAKFRADSKKRKLEPYPDWLKRPSRYRTAPITASEDLEMIRELRSLGLTTSDIIKMTGKSQATVYEWNSQRQSVDPASRRRLSFALKLAQEIILLAGAKYVKDFFSRPMPQLNGRTPTETILYTDDQAIRSSMEKLPEIFTA